MPKLAKKTTKNKAKKSKSKKIQRANLKARQLIKGLLGLFVVVFFIALFVLINFVRELPSPSRLGDQQLPLSTILTDRNGQVLYEIYADTNRKQIKLKDLPDHVSQATIAIEDKDFYHHLGFSIAGITRAFKNNLLGDNLQGGSTITQQLVKVGLLTPERTITRKIKEAFLTVGTELRYSKSEILEMYLNYIPYGGTAWGIESAAQAYFDKSAKDLTVAEAALLAGLPAAPSRFSPFGANPELSRNRQQEVLRRMHEDGYLTQEQLDQATSEQLSFATDKIVIKAPHFALYVKDLLTEKYGLDTVEKGGLKVVTSLDLDIQTQAEASLAAQIKELEEYDVGNGAALVTKPNTGEILAMVGSKNFFDQSGDGQVNVVFRPRQPGSSIKPINYATGLETKKITAATMFLDIPTCFESAGTKLYCPRNYDGSFRGPVQTRFALGNSYNIPAVKALAVNSLETFIATASAMGINSFKDSSRYGLSLTLGGGEVTMAEMAVSFATLANQGVTVPLRPILSVSDRNGNILEEYYPDEIAEAVNTMNLDPTYQEPGSHIQLPSPGENQDEIDVTRALHRAPAFITAHIMLDNNARAGAFGVNSKLNIKGQTVSVKTGTTNNLRDNWTIGFTPEILTAVWVGNNDNTPMRRSVVSGVTGAAPIFNDIMTFLLSGKEPVWPEQPDDVISRPVCVITGLVSHPDRPCQTRNEYFWQGTEPGEFEQLSKEIWVKEDSGLPPEPGDTQGLKLETHQVLSDPLVKDYCLDCPTPLDEEGKPLEKRSIINMSSLTTAKNP